MNKVKIEELPVSYKNVWVIDLLNHVPYRKNTNSQDIANFISYSINLQKKHPEGSVVKYAIRTISKNVNESNVNVFLKYSLSLAFHYPVILPIICNIAEKYKTFINVSDIVPILKRSINLNRSDAICWSIYIIYLCDLDLDFSIVDDIINSKDCMSIAMLLLFEDCKDNLINFVSNLNDSIPHYDFDKYWILIHELANDIDHIDKIKTYRQKTGLKFLYDKGVRFVDPSKT